MMDGLLRLSCWTRILDGSGLLGLNTNMHFHLEFKLKRLWEENRLWTRPGPTQAASYTESNSSKEPKLNWCYLNPVKTWTQNRPKMDKNSSQKPKLPRTGLDLTSSWLCWPKSDINRYPKPVLYKPDLSPLLESYSIL